MGYVTKINNETTARRNQLKSIMDDFCTFSWGGCPDMFREYGAFVVGGKDALKFYNGPGFSNEYAQPQFNKTAGQLQGVNFTTQQISFTMGVYWITEEDYRKLIYLLHPLRVNFLAFGFETKYGYQAKLSKLGDSTRNPIGRNEDGKIVYYTEIPLTFEVQGAQCAIAQNPFEWNTDIAGGKILNTIKQVEDTPEWSDLSFPIEYSYSAKLPTGGEHKISLVARGKGNKSITLFDLILQNTTSEMEITIKYKSDLGIVFLQYGNGIEKILSMITTTDTGDSLVKSLICNKFEIPGIFDGFLVGSDSIQLELQCPNTGGVVKITAWARTNVI